MLAQTFVEQDCKITLQGQTFESGGAYLLDCTDGHRRGVVYVHERPHEVRTWHGETIAPASFSDYRGNFCKMRRVSFTLHGRRYVGDYCPDWSEVCKVRTTKAI